MPAPLPSFGNALITFGSSAKGILARAAQAQSFSFLPIFLAAPPKACVIASNHSPVSLDLSFFNAASFPCGAKRRIESITSNSPGASFNWLTLFTSSEGQIQPPRCVGSLNNATAPLPIRWASSKLRIDKKAIGEFGR